MIQQTSEQLDNLLKELKEILSGYFDKTEIRKRGSLREGYRASITFKTTLCIDDNYFINYSEKCQWLAVYNMERKDKKGWIKLFNLQDYDKDKLKSAITEYILSLENKRKA